ncbi:MAG: DUF2076 domain-containing protein [Devosia sp.]
MLAPEDRRAIESLFDRLRDVARRNPDRDHEAEALIQQEGGRTPGAGYYMAQTIIVQERALEAAQQRIAELEQHSQNRGGFFDSIFGDGGRQNPRQTQAAPVPDHSPNRGPWDRPRGGGGGGFLAGAAQTALGVTGGVLLGSAIAGMLGGGDANAAEAPPEAGAADDAAADDGGGDFDLGGEF